MEVNDSSGEVEVFSDSIKQYGSITLNSSIFKNVNVTGMFSLKWY